MIEALVGLEKMTVHQCEELAKDMPDGSTFDLCGPKGKLGAKWLDPWFGIFILDGQSGFTMSRDFTYAKDVWCENLMPPKKNE